MVADTLALALRIGDQELRTFCENEIAGYPEDCELPPYRKPKMFLSLHEFNPQYIGWGGQALRVLQHLRANPSQYPQISTAMQLALSDFESTSLPSNSLSIMQRKVRDFPVSTPLDPETPVFLYASPDIYQQILSGIRQEITRRLLSKLRVLVPKST
ncbi:AbiTii domain-containing protein [Archangium lipolyticum]|uniref:AbiTii domain-containing protein n=1 Tax=Archangium lipolyticum TaxID=2970465 RepID=UPI002149B34A|nr:hypothetical protein [Archangium lipolyticum]